MSIDARDLRAEMVRRVNDGWDVVGDLTPHEMRMVHAVDPPAWRIALVFLNPLTWMGVPDLPTAVRRLHVWRDADGQLHRKTDGEVPRSWKQARPWEVPDGPITP